MIKSSFNFAITFGTSNKYVSPVHTAHSLYMPYAVTKFYTKKKSY